MKINFINKVYIISAIVWIILIIHKTLKYKSWDRYYYASSVCTHEYNPIYVINCYFLTADINDFVSINYNSVNEFISKWGDEEFLEARESLRLPQQLVIEYVSYVDKKFYRDTLDLPENKIREIFKAAEENNNLDKLYSYGGNKMGLHFLIGIANKGNIIIWLRGVFLEDIIIKAKITPKEPLGSQTYYETKLSEEEYLDKVFHHISDSLKRAVRLNQNNSNYIDSSTYYIERNFKYWKRQKNKGI